MDPVNYQDKEHAELIAKAIDLLQWPHHCHSTGRAKEDLIKLKMSKGELLDSMRSHLREKLPLYMQLQTMSEIEPIIGYVFCPLLIIGRDLRIFCKFKIPTVEYEKDEKLFILSNHFPEFPCPGESK